MIYAVGKTNPHKRYGYADFRIAEELFERVEKVYVHGKLSALFRVPFELYAKNYRLYNEVPSNRDSLTLSVGIIPLLS